MNTFTRRYRAQYRALTYIGYRGWYASIRALFEALR
jgi:hypothetical protein